MKAARLEQILVTARNKCLTFEKKQQQLLWTRVRP